MKKETPAAVCPLQYAVSILGDKWSLLIIRDIMFFGITSYSEFLAKEKIASNILQSRLSKLTQEGLLHRRGAISSKTKVLYTLTDEAIELLPVILELIAWGTKHVHDEQCMQLVKNYRRDPYEVVARLKSKILAVREATNEQMLH